MSLDDLYRRVILEHYQKPKNRGRIENGAITIDLNNPTCGDKISLQMRIEDGRVQDAKFLGRLFHQPGLRFHDDGSGQS